ncbi:MAG: hypothetical protein Q7K03_01415 [Dehalococcoidia bacterium]|nr:hypothetical protein [Dehalococcoidia bacterium]
MTPKVRYGDPTAGFWVKVERAEHHLRDLDQAIQGFLKRKPYSMVKEEDLNTGSYIWRCKVSEQPPIEWSAVIGDIVHNLRSALDLLACELVLLNKGKVTEYTSFPIADSRQKFESIIAGKVKGASKAAMDGIIAAKPYLGGNDAFWHLHRLDILDKHHILIPVGAATQSVVIDFAADFAARFPGSNLARDFPPLPIGIVPANNQFPLKDGTILFRSAMFDDKGYKENITPQFVFEISFGEGEIFKGDPIVPTLKHIGEVVANTVAGLAPLFRQTSTDMA